MLFRRTRPAKVPKRRHYLPRLGHVNVEAAVEWRGWFHHAVHCRETRAWHEQLVAMLHHSVSKPDTTLRAIFRGDDEQLAKERSLLNHSIWNLCSFCSLSFCLISRFTHCTVEGLSPSHDYQFRAIAENLYGRSDPCEPTSLIQTVTEQEGRRKKGLGGADGMWDRPQD